MLLLLLRHRGCLSDITGALFCSPGTLRGWLSHLICFCLWLVPTGLSACFCHKMASYQPGEYDHCVLYTTAQLTEGRSARINPSSRQQKKIVWSCAARHDSRSQVSPSMTTVEPVDNCHIFGIATTVLGISKGCVVLHLQNRGKAHF